MRTIWDKYSGEAHAIIYVVDAADPERFPESRDEFMKVMELDDALDAPVR